MLSDTVKNQMILSLKRELVPAMGCTEPIALSFAGAKAREILGEEVQTAVARCSGNILKMCGALPSPILTEWWELRQRWRWELQGAMRQQEWK